MILNKIMYMNINGMNYIVEYQFMNKYISMITQI
jgi:hypothetical protein